MSIFADEAVAFLNAAPMRFGWDARTGAHDCCSLVAAFGLSIGAVDLLAGLRGYRSERGALKALRRGGYRTIEALARDRLDEIPIGEMGGGDVGFVRNETAFGGGLGLFDRRELVGIGPDGVMRAQRHAAASAFRFRVR